MNGDDVLYWPDHATCSNGHRLRDGHSCECVLAERRDPVEKLAKTLGLRYWYVPCGNPQPVVRKNLKSAVPALLLAASAIVD